MANIGSLVGNLDLQSATFIRAMDRSSRAMDKFSRSGARAMRGVEQASRNVQRAVGQLTGVVNGLAAAFAIRQFGRFTKDALDAASAILDVSRVAGVGVARLQELRFAADQVGLGAGALDTGLRDLNRRLGEFVNTGAGQAKQAFDQLGLSSRIASGELRNSEQVFDAVVEALQRVPSAAQQAALAAQLFGRSAGPQMTLLLREGTEGIDEMRQRARDLGLVLGDDLVAQAKRASDNLAAMRSTFSSAFQIGIIRSFGTSIDDISQTTQTLARAGREMGQAVGTAVRGIAVAAEFAARHFRELVAVAAAFAALKIAGVAIGAAAAVGKLAAALFAAARAGAVLNTVLSKNIIGALGRLAVAAAAAAGVWKLLGDEIDVSAEMSATSAAIDDMLGSLDAVTESTDQTADAMGRLMREQGREREHLEALLDAHKKNEAAVRTTQRAIRIDIELRRANISRMDAEASGLLELMVRNEELKASIEGVVEAQREAARAAAERAAAEERQREEAARQAEEAARISMQPLENALRSFQATVTDFFDNVLAGRVSNFGAQMVAVARRFVAEMATLEVFRLAGIGGGASMLSLMMSGGSAAASTGGALAGIGGAGGLLGGINAFGGSLGFSVPAASGVGPPTAGFFGGTATLAGTLGAGAAGALGGNILTSMLGLGKTGGTIGGGLGAGIGMVAGGPLGALLGGVGGSLLGGGLGKLFKSKGSDKSQTAAVDLSRQSIATWGLEGKKFSQANRDAADAFASAALDLSQVLERLTGGKAGGGLRIQIGDRDGMRLFQGGQQLISTKDRETFERSIIDAVARGVSGGSAIQQQVLRRADRSSVDSLVADLEFGRMFERLVSPSSAVATALGELVDRFNDVRQTALRLGLDVRALNQAQREQIDAMARGLVAQRDAAAQQIRDFFTGILDPLRAARTGLALGPSSALGAGARFELAQAEFQRTRQAALGGDLTAIQSLPQIGQALIEAAARFGASPAQADAFQQVMAALDQTISRQEQQERAATRALPPASERTVQDQLRVLQDGFRSTVQELQELRRELKRLGLPASRVG